MPLVRGVVWGWKKPRDKKWKYERNHRAGEARWFTDLPRSDSALIISAKHRQLNPVCLFMSASLVIWGSITLIIVIIALQLPGVEFRVSGHSGQYWLVTRLNNGHFGLVENGDNSIGLLQGMVITKSLESSEYWYLPPWLVCCLLQSTDAVMSSNEEVHLTFCKNSWMMFVDKSEYISTEPPTSPNLKTIWVFCSDLEVISGKIKYRACYIKPWHKWVLLTWHLQLIINWLELLPVSGGLYY